MEVLLSDISNALGTRVIAKEIRLSVEDSIRGNNFVVFNLDGVMNISHSFADELFGKLLLTWTISELKEKTTFKNVSPKLMKVITFVINERLSEVTV